MGVRKKKTPCFWRRGLVLWGVVLGLGEGLYLSSSLESLYPRGSSAQATQGTAPTLEAHVTTVRRPMGLILEEQDSGLGVQIARIDPEGNAVGADLLIGDLLVAVNGVRCDELRFEDVMDLIGAQEEPEVELALRRPDGAIRVSFPNGIGVAASPGESLADLAADCLWPVRYSCDAGDCGTCEHKICSDHGGERYARVCVARVPKSATSLDVISRD